MRFPKFCVFFLAFFLVESAFALRCGRHLIDKGDGFGKVAKYCGNPTNVQTRSIIRTRGVAGERKLRTQRQITGQVYDQVSVEIVVEEWDYNFGPQRLSRRITFEDGVVAKITSIGYGY